MQAQPIITNTMQGRSQHAKCWQAADFMLPVHARIGQASKALQDSFLLSSRRRLGRSMANE